MLKLLIAVATLAALIGVTGCSSAGKKDAQMAKAHYKLGILHLNDNKVQHAFIEFQKAIENDRDNKHYHNALGNVYILLEDLRKAEDSFRKSISLDKNYSDAHNNLCYVCYMTQRYEMAIESCKDALKNSMYLTPEKAFFNLGRSYYMLRRFKEAAAAYKDALRRAPAMSPAYYNLALTHNAMGNYGEASTSLNKAIEYDSRFEGDRKKAEEHFRTVQVSPEEIENIENLLEILNY